MRFPRFTPKVWRTIAILGTALVVVLCFMPGRHVLAPHVIGLDKVFHALAFFAVGFAWHRTGLPARRVFVLGVLLAAGTEIGQAVLPGGRTGDLLDVASDVLGVVLGVLVSLRLRSPVRCTAAAKEEEFEPR